MKNDISRQFIAGAAIFICLLFAQPEARGQDSLGMRIAGVVLETIAPPKMIISNDAFVVISRGKSGLELYSEDGELFGRIESGLKTGINDIVLRDSVVYASQEDGTLSSYQLPEGNHLDRIRLGQRQCWPRLAIVSDTLLIMACSIGGAQDTLFVIDVRDSGNMSVLGGLGLPGRFGKLIPFEDRAYFAGISSIGVVNLSNPREPSLSMVRLDRNLSFDYKAIFGHNLLLGTDVFDLSDRDHPRFVCALDGINRFDGIYVKDTLLYQSRLQHNMGRTYLQFTIENVADVTNPMLVCSQWSDLPFPVRGADAGESTPMTLAGGKAWILNWEGVLTLRVDSLAILDSLMENLRFGSVANTTSLWGQLIEGDRLFTVETVPQPDLCGIRSQLRVFNISDPYRPEVRSSVSHRQFEVGIEWGTRIKLAQDRLYYSGSMRGSPGVAVVDVANQLEPTILLEEMLWENYVFEVYGNYIYNSVAVYDAANPRGIRFVRQYNQDDFRANDLLRHGGWLYALSSIRCQVFDLTEPANPCSVAVIEMPESNFARHIAISQDRLFINRSTREIHGEADSTSVYDISDPVHPELIRNISPLPAPAVLTTDYYITATDSLLTIWNVRNLEAVREVGWYSDPDLHLGGLSRYALVGDALLYFGNSPVLIFDCSAAMGENVVPIWRNPPDSLQVREGNLLRVTLRAVDMNGDSIRLSANRLPEGANFRDEGGGQGLLLWIPTFQQAGTYCPRFIATDGNLSDSCEVVLSVENVSRAPILNSMIPDVNCAMGDTTYTLARLDTVFSIPDTTGLQVEIINNHRWTGLIIDYPLLMLTPQAERINRPYEAVVYVSTEEGVASDTFTVTINPMLVSGGGRLPSCYALPEPYPNPFNGATRISYDLPADGLVRVTVVDLVGRQVSELASERVSAGRHSVVWNADGIASGIYIVRMEAANFKASQKVVLVR